jgi:hypothetical protein
LAALLGAINKFVALDLSESTGMTVFDPDNTTSAGEDKIVSLVLPDTAESVKVGTSSASTFKNFTALKSVAGKAKEIGTYAFSNCDALTTVSLPETTTIGNSPFYDCSVLETVSLPKAITIEPSAFDNCTSLTEVDLPIATTIGDGVFFYCTALTTITLPAATDIGEAAFRYCTKLEEVSLPEATTIGNEAFYDCIKLEEVSLPETTTIGQQAFNNCTTLAEVSLPEATTIGNEAFRACTSLTEVSLPEVATIGDRAFYTCTSLTTVTLGLKVPKLGVRLFQDVSTQTVTVQVPSGEFAWSGIISGSPYEETSPYTNNWGNAFRGLGWDGLAYQSGTVNDSIKLTIETYTPSL